ncbi:nucleoside hydrolase [Ferrimonas senticii]|uniref:nucleoside hydrolase n=1 Tax=Ferrimonas senticii TaxID=394566 RepID=UPI00040B6ACA|nr:nucleoside hydrolase [Ferrimonas senticii]
MTQTIIFDTDPGIDDAMALLFAHALPNIDLYGITTVFGNATIDDGTKNACYLRDRFGINAIIAKGADKPLVRPPVGPTTIVHGEHGLGYVEAPADTAINLDPRPAYQFLCEEVKRRSGEITIVAVGPLTNLALALQHDPEITQHVKQVVIMGGAFGLDGNCGNVAPFAEANIHDDPHAADLVFTADWPVVIVGLDVTHKAFFSGEYLDALRDSAGETGQFIHDISRFYLEFYSNKVGLNGCHVHDPSAIAYVADPSLFGTRSGPVRVVCDGPLTGMTVQKVDARRYSDDEFSDHRAQQVCVSVDDQRLLKLYQDSINRLA